MAFFALPIPAEMQAHLSEELKPLRKNWPEVQWVHPEDFHVTLRFLGGLHAGALARLQEEITGRGLPFESFFLDLKGISCFPPRRDNGVLWIGFETLPPHLMDLQQRLEMQVQELGFAAEKRAYTPHLTIGRFKSAHAAPILDALSSLDTQAWGRILCHEYVLMKRRYGARDRSPGPLYEVLSRFSV